MYFQTRILFVSFIATVILSIFIIPILRKLRVGQIERDDGPKSHFKKEGTPTMGGVIIALGIIIGTIGGFIYYLSREPEIGYAMLPLLLMTIGFGVIGFIDDFKKLVLKDTKGLKPKQKMLGLLIISVAYVIYLVSVAGVGTETLIPFLGQYFELPIWVYIPFATFVLLAMTNAVNLTDGVDGLSTSISAIMATCLTVIAIILDVKEIIVFGSIIVGACLGFLIFNLNTAKVFMGDTGALLLGGVLSAMALYLRMPFILLIIGIIPVLETVSVMLQVIYFKKTGGKRLFKMAPLHHHFELSGWKENKVVGVFCVITLMMSVIGLYSI
ncbi:MAG: phospho-N-acetylmuramoyl-pentapeptide-transferase [Oscillospiraceae bacterium]|nr:phospho-N-acetylmuramoyl-pentapeptide-transferase [Oscillospiraceae bacterium]